MVVAVLGFLIVVGLVVAWRRQRHKPQGDVYNVGSTNAAEAPHPNGRGALSATSDDMLYETIPALSLNKVTLADGPSSATPAIPSDRHPSSATPAIPSDRRPSYYNPVYAAPSSACAVTQEHEARMPLRQRSSSYESAIDKLGLDDCPKPGPVAMAWVEQSSDGLPADRMAIEPDNTGVPDPNDGYIHTVPSTPATAVHPPVRPPDDMFGAVSAYLDHVVESAMDAVDTTHADYELPSTIKVVNLAPTVRPTVESAVDAAHADYGVPMPIKATKPAPTSGLEDQYAAVDYAEITGMAGDAIYEDLNSTGTVEPIEDATYDVIPPPSFDKDTLQGKMQDAVDAVDAAHAEYGVPMPIKVTSPAPTSGLENTALVEDATYEDMESTGAVEPIEDATYDYDVIPTQSFEQDTLKRKMQIGADGGLRLASVHRTNPLATNAATGDEPIPPTMRESTYAEISQGGAESIADVVGTDTIYEELAGHGQPTA